MHAPHQHLRATTDDLAVLQAHVRDAGLQLLSVSALHTLDRFATTHLRVARDCLATAPRLRTTMGLVTVVDRHCLDGLRAAVRIVVDELLVADDHGMGPMAPSDHADHLLSWLTQLPLGTGAIDR